MGDGTGIQWTDATWNPLRARRWANGSEGWACVRVSPGCANCYASTLNESQRWGRGTGLAYTVPNLAKVEHYLDEATLTQPLRWKKPRRVFVCSMTDLFGEWVTDDQLDSIFAVMALTPQHTYQVLTKRPERMRAYLGSDDPDRYTCVDGEASAISGEAGVGVITRWPLPNVWLGVSVEDQQRADERIPVLLDTPAAVRFLSCEPLLGPVDLIDPFHEYDNQHHGGLWDWIGHTFAPDPDAGLSFFGRPYCKTCGNEEPNPMHRGLEFSGPYVDWVIVGGESGPNARPFDLAWARSLVQQCADAGVSYFFKQGGASNRCPHSGHGSHLDCVPTDLQVREWPHVV